MKNIPFSQVKITGGFWKEKQELIRNTTARAVYERFRETHRFDALKCTWKEGEPDMPHIFWDSDVAKWIEGVAYLLAWEKDEELEAIAEEAIGDIIRNSDEHGYFNSHFLVTEQDQRFQKRECHELYCAGHLIEAAIAYRDATGKDAFLKAMCRFADYIEQVFVKEKSAAFVTPGHPELELALVKLYHATGEKRYLELSKFFIDEHGLHEEDRDFYLEWAEEIYNQDEVPLRDRSTAEGHCVRALYLLAAMADIAEEYEDEALKAACERCFHNVVDRRMYITGGVGSSHKGEAFTIDFHLPNRTAYAETCASIALALFAQRMLKLEPKAVYADTVERALYNGMLSGLSMDGKSFFYENPLEIDPDFNHVSPSVKDKERYPITERLEVFGCSCCPPNLLRVIASIADFVSTQDEDTVYLHQYVDSELHSDEIHLVQTTDYPRTGTVRICCSAPQKYLALRIPGWCRNFTLNCAYELKNGYAYVALHGETEVVLTLDMPVTVMAANRRVHDNAGRVAVTRGPIVYCMEGVDNGADLKSVRIDPKGAYELCDEEFLLPSLETAGYRPVESDELYMPAEEAWEEVPLRLIPFYAFANRGTTEMQVWILRK